MILNGYAFQLSWRNFNKVKKLNAFKAASKNAKDSQCGFWVFRGQGTSWQAGVTSDAKAKGLISAASSFVESSKGQTSAVLIEIEDKSYWLCFVINGVLAENSDLIVDKIDGIDNLDAEFSLGSLDENTKLFIDNSLSGSEGIDKLVTDYNVTPNFTLFNEFKKKNLPKNSGSKIKPVPVLKATTLLLYIVGLIVAIYFGSGLFGGVEEVAKKQAVSWGNKNTANEQRRNARKQAENKYRTFIQQSFDEELQWSKNIISHTSPSRFIRLLKEHIQTMSPVLRNWEAVKLRYRASIEELRTNKDFQYVVEINWKRIQGGDVLSLQKALIDSLRVQFDPTGSDAKQYLLFSPELDEFKGDAIDFYKGISPDLPVRVKSLLQLNESLYSDWSIRRTNELNRARQLKIPNEFGNQILVSKFLVLNGTQFQINGSTLSDMERLVVEVEKITPYVITSIDFELSGEDVFSWSIQGYFVGEFVSQYQLEG